MTAGLPAAFTCHFCDAGYPLPSLGAYLQGPKKSLPPRLRSVAVFLFEVISHTVAAHALIADAVPRRLASP